MTISLIFVLLALVFGLVILVQEQGRDWRAWGVVICLVVVLVLSAGIIRLS